MARVIFLILIFATQVYAAGIGATFMGGSSDGYGESPTGNIWDEDGDVFGVYNFEMDALSTDSSGLEQTLTEVNTLTYDGTYYKQGLGSARFNFANNEYAYRTNTSLVTGHPFKSTTGEHDFSVTFWLRRRSDLSSVSYVMAKYNAVADGRTYAILLDNNSTENTGTPHSIYFNHGYNSGNSFSSGFETDVTLVLNRWYFVAATYTASTNTHTCRIWDDTGQQWLTLGLSSWEAPADMSVGTSNFSVGNRHDGDQSRQADVNMDELVIFDRVLIDDDIDAIRMQLYGH